MKKLLSILTFLICTIGPAWATHLRGGEITARRRCNTPATFDFTLTIYRDTTSIVRDANNRLFFGDGTSAEAPIATSEILRGYATERLTYEFTHTYSSPGQYLIYHWREYRNDQVRNLGAPGNTVNFYVETQITLSPTIDQLGCNNSPVLLTFAVDLAGLNQVYLHNPTAYDPDGDSISFALAPSRDYRQGVGPVALSGYTFPNRFSGAARDSANTGPATLTIDPRTGLLRWDVAFPEGEFNVAYVVYEWRLGRRIGYVLRDMQIIVKDVRNRRPFLTLPQDTCLFAEDRIDKFILVKDRDSLDRLVIQASGGMFNLNPLPVRALISPQGVNAGGGFNYQGNPARTRFIWQPGCFQVREQPWLATFNAKDLPFRLSAATSLVDVQTWSIKVMGKPPEGLRATPGLGSIRLDWNRPYVCPNIRRFRIYRRVDSSFYRPDTCVTGLPAESGYRLIDTTSNYNYIDTDRGRGLDRSKRYCYRITAEFIAPELTESKPSDFVCAQLRLDVPLLLNVSVRNTSPTAGQMFVRWSRPKDLDTIRFPGPYRYILKRQTQGGSFSTIYQTASLADTTYTDLNLNTDRQVFTYRVVFEFADVNGTYRDSAADASSILLEGAATPRSVTLSWSAQVPWDNAAARGGADSAALPYRHSVFKRIGGNWQLIGQVPGNTPNFTDVGRPGDTLRAGSRYQYYVLTRGRYSISGLPRPLENLSYELTVRVPDTVRPCPPQRVELTNQNLPCPTCEQIRRDTTLANTLRWRSPKRDSCPLDLIGYRVYFKPTLRAPFALVGTTADTFFVHTDNGSLAGCYRVAALDSSGNESLVVDSVCNDNCVAVELPNIITANGDGLNAAFTPICITQAYVSEAGLSVYNRWGRLVYSSNALDIRWPPIREGQSQLEPGVYYYHLRLKTKRLDDSNPFQTFRGWIEVVKTDR